ncbi:hypothetical protein Q7A53_21140 [Halobacillus rhizosphaerae]
MVNKSISAQEVLAIIQVMDNEERWKLLNELYYLHYSSPEEKYMELDMDY